jgi:cytidylate kinase
MKPNSMRGSKLTMKREYDFSKGVRGKFYRKGAQLRLPIYLDAKLQKQIEKLAEKNGKNVNDLVNQLVQREVELIEEFS